MKQTKKSVAYLRFLHFVQAIQGSPDFPAMDLQARFMLERLAQRWYAGDPVTVLEVMNDSASGLSPSTVHRRLKDLRSAGMVELKADEADRRVKYIMPTPLAMRYFDRLGQCISTVQRLV